MGLGLLNFAFFFCIIFPVALGHLINSSISYHTPDIIAETIDVEHVANVAPTRNRSRIYSHRECKKISEFEGMNIKPMDCEDYFHMGCRRSGVYRIWPRNKILNGRSLDVFCDMETDKGGWTVIQRRGDFLRPNDYFFKDWKDYKNGFGDIERDFWLGNDNIFVLTNQKLYSARFDLKDVEGLQLYALYDKFYIDDEGNNYRLTIQDYSGTANDSMISHNTQLFSTKDRDNDSHKTENCANLYKGGWWYGACHEANLNGLYLKGKHEVYAVGINWNKWKGYHDSLQEVEIKLRSNQFRKTLA